MSKNYIEIKNARIHNLRNVNVSIPKNKLTVITGVSGSGKSSLAFDTLYEEGKRRYLMFSGTQFMVDSVPSFDSITGLSPTVAVEQRIIRQANPRSTVGTRVKISALLAALLASQGQRDPAYDDGIPLDISMFQKNSPRGMCVKCMGNGTVFTAVEEEIFTDYTVSLQDLFGGEQSLYKHLLRKFQYLTGITPQQCLIELTPEQLDCFKYGDSEFEGLLPWLTDKFRWSQGKHNWVSRLTCVRQMPCPKCGGTGLGLQASHTTFGGKNIAQLEDMYLRELLDFFREQGDARNPLVKEIITKLSCMVDVGLHHLSLSRPVPSLSGGEIQRLFLAGYLIAEMDSMIFVFDEPTIGLHEIEKENLIRIIRRLVDTGNTVVAVEHDENFMRAADYIIDMGPEAGTRGGIKIYEGGFADFLRCAESKTAPYLAQKDLLCGIKKDNMQNDAFGSNTAGRPLLPEKMLTLSGVRLHNLRNVTVQLPLGVMVGVCGVSGSGKSSLISDTLVPKLKELLKAKCVTGDGEEDEKVVVDAVLTGTEHLRHCYVIDQRPIGRSRTSCPATYTGIFDRVRAMFADTPQARALGYTPGLFSVNSEGGCPRCKGDGVLHYHVGFGNFVDVTCEDCGGSGYIPEAIEITLEGRNIREILEMSVEEAADFFDGKDKMICNMLHVLKRVGMGYIRLGQATPTISGGESQRIKLAKELSKGKNAKGSLYILDEPTTGLSFYDNERLLKLLNELVDCGNSIIVTEHDPYILSNCDYLVEMGPGGGCEGGCVIASGTPAQLKSNPDSMIGRYLYN